MLQNRVLRRIFGIKRKEVVGGWRKLHNEELHNLYSSLNIITVIKSRLDEVTGVYSMCGTHEKCTQNFIQ
jgi:hypothetical protein